MPRKQADAIALRPLANDADADRCARVMSTSEPWQTLGRGYDASLAVVRDPASEVHIAELGNKFAGFVILQLAGPLNGYIRTIAVAPEFRGHGVGTRIIELAEERIFRVSPNAFLCVSSFNDRARALYERLGYRYVGEFADFIVSGHSELLYRKTRGPWSGFARAEPVHPVSGHGITLTTPPREPPA